MLGVESPLVCDLLPHADPQTGLFDVELVDKVGKGMGSSEEMEVISHDAPAPAEMTTNKVTKQTTYKSSSVKDKNGEASTTVVQESVEIVDGVKTTVKKVIIDGVVTDEETIHEKDGVILDHSQVFKENIEDVVEIQYEQTEHEEEEKKEKDEL